MKSYKHPAFLILFLSIIKINPALSQKDCPTIVLEALSDFSQGTKDGYVAYYKDEARSALAVDAAQFKRDYALAKHVFKGSTAKYIASINTISENDGESSYRLFVNDSLVKEVQNVPKERNFIGQTLYFGEIILSLNDTIEIAFNTDTNGKIPEGDTTAYSRGRWTSLHLNPICGSKESYEHPLLRHLVLFSFKEDSPKKKLQEIEEAFGQLSNKIPQVYSFEWGLNNSPEGLNKGYTHCFLLSFISEEDRSIYLPHPAHKAFVALMKPFLNDVLVVDYWSKPN